MWEYVLKKYLRNNIKKHRMKWTNKQKEIQYEKEEGMLNLIYFTIEEQNLDYKLMEMSKQY